MMNEIKKALPGIPGVTPGKAHPDHRAARKQYEKENPHFNMQEFGLKAGVLALMGALAFVPWEKKYDEHVAEHHPERLEKGNDRDRRRRRSVDERRPTDRRRNDGRRRSIEGRHSERGARREHPAERDWDRRRSVAGDYGRHEEERYRPVGRARTGGSESESQNSMRLAVAEGFEYLPANRAYLDTKRSTNGADVDMRVYTDDYQFRPQRANDERRRR